MRDEEVGGTEDNNCEKGKEWFFIALFKHNSEAVGDWNPVLRLLVAAHSVQQNRS